MKLFQFLRWKKQQIQGNPSEEEMPSVLSDAIFKAMLASDNEDSREALRFLLCACTNREISNVKVINNELSPAYFDAKSPRLDVHVTFNDGEVAALEMQIGKYDDDLRNRAPYYAAMLQSGQLRRGKKYEDIKRVYQIFFLNCELFPESTKLPRRYGYREEKEYDLLTEAVEIIYYELPKLKKKAYAYISGKAGTETLSPDEKWCIFMKYRDNKQMEPLIKKLCREEEGIMCAEKSLSKISWSYKRYMRNVSKIKARMEWEARQAMSKEDLEEERRMLSRTAEEEYRDLLVNGSRNETKREIARKILAEGLTPEFVQKITGLRMCEIIEELQGLIAK